MFIIKDTTMVALRSLLEQAEDLYNQKSIQSSDLGQFIYASPKDNRWHTGMADCLHHFYKLALKNSKKTNNHYVLTYEDGYNLIYEIWDIITDINVFDRHDIYLNLNFELHKLWLKLITQATPKLKKKFLCDTSCLTIDELKQTYLEDMKNMQLEKKYYWKNVRKYSWSSLRMSKDRKHVQYIDDVDEDTGKITKTHVLANN